MKKSGVFRLLMSGAIVVVLLNTWMAEHALATLFTAQGWLAHTLETITHTEAISLDMRSADSAVRAFLLTGSPVFEQRYQEAMAGVNSEVDQFQRLTGDNVSQQARISYLRTRIAAKKGVLDAGISMRHSRPDEAIAPSELQPVLSDYPGGGQSVQYAVTQIENEEHRLLQQRTQETKVARRQVWVSFIVASALDVLLLVAAFEQLIRANRDRVKIQEGAGEIALLNSELHGMNAELESRVEQRTRELEVSNKELEAFSYSVSHDLRAPLRTIDGFSLALQEDFADKLNEEGLDYIARVRNGVQRMGSLIDALLQLSRVTRSEVQRERLDMTQLATMVFQELQANESERKVTFVAQPGVLAQADPRLVRIALENLMGNAWKFTAKTEDATIEFGSVPIGQAGSAAGRELALGPDRGSGRGAAGGLADASAVYFIRDNGAGFDMQYVDRLFTAFQRLHGDRDFKGSGIGLATVSRIIRRHHGSIWAEGDVGKGATFFFTLDAPNTGASGSHTIR